MQLRSEPRIHAGPLLKESIDKLITNKTTSFSVKSKASKAKLIVDIRVIRNDGDRQSLKTLISLKNIISRQLPKMPRQYITKIVFDRKHQVIIAIHNNGIIAGACFRCFPEKPFAELVFLAVEQSFRVCGLGSQLIDQLKELLQERKVGLLLTYADFSAIGFFRKQAFEKTVDTAEKEWSGYIKAYEGGALMECRVEGQFKYSKFKDILDSQKKGLIKKLHAYFSSCEVEYSVATLKSIARRKTALDLKEEDSTDNEKVDERQFSSFLSVEDVPGVLENGWCQQKEEQLQIKPQTSFMLTQLYAIESVRKLPLCKLIRSMQHDHELRLPLDFPTIEKKIIRGDNYSNGDLCKDLKTIPAYLRNNYSEELGGIDQMEKKMDAILQLLKEKRLMIPMENLREGRTRSK